MGHRFKKAFGQNFLRSTRFIQTLIDEAGVKPGDTVLEIGPGEGNITQQLLSRGAKVVCVEVDYDLIVALAKRFGPEPELEIIHQDILDFNIANHPLLAKGYTCIGSLPYNISKQIIAKVVTQEPVCKAAAFIVQEEVAKEYVATPPEASFLSSYIRIYADVRKSLSIPASQFFPRPQVNGGIIKLVPHDKFNQQSQKNLHKVIKVGFTMPRKTLLNNLGNLPEVNKQEIQRLIVTELKLSPTVRPAEMSFENWQRLASYIYNSNHTNVETK